MASGGTNGASLEDCHTNVFVLTELNGLRWKKFTPSKGTRGLQSINEDPLLLAYGKCLSDLMLCVWRRENPAQHGAVMDSSSGAQRDSVVDLKLKLDVDKELWVFWYGSEPDHLGQYTKALNCSDQGSWQDTTGIYYEVRILLFKALHNLIERCLLNRGFVRLGKWFTMPLEPLVGESDDGRPCHVMAYGFSFFVHGENNVCVNVNVQRQPAIERLCKRHLTQEVKQTVLLSPWCVRATLPPGANHQIKDDCLWKDWQKFYPVVGGADDNTENLGYEDPLEKEQKEKARAAAVPKMVEVEMAGGVRTFHPSCYVLIVESEDNLRHETHGPGSATTSPKKDGTPAGRASGRHASGGSQKRRFDSQGPFSDDRCGVAEKVCGHHAKYVSGARSLQRAAEELTINRKTPSSQSPATANTGESTPTSTDMGLQATVGDEYLRWNYVDCCRLEKCGCKLSTSLAVATKAAQKVGSSSRSKMIRQATFHRRSPSTVKAESNGLESAGSSTQLTTSTSAAVDASSSNNNCLKSVERTTSGNQSTSFTPISIASPAMVSSAQHPVYQNISPVATQPCPQHQFGGSFPSGGSAVPSTSSSSISNGLASTTVVGSSVVGGSTGGSSSSRSAGPVKHEPCDQAQFEQKPQYRKLFLHPKPQKRPKLDSHDPFANSLHLKEQFSLDGLLGQTNQARPVWWGEKENADQTDCVDESSSINAAPVADSRVDRKSSITNPLEGLIRIQPDSSGGHELERLLKADDDDYGKRANASQAANDPSTTYSSTNSQNQLPSAMPDIFMDSGQATTVPSTLSPPPSNERNDSHSTTTSFGNSSTQLRNPPSVEYTRIYPTPPSIEHMLQFSPQNLLNCPAAVAQVQSAMVAAAALSAPLASSTNSESFNPYQRLLTNGRDALQKDEQRSHNVVDRSQVTAYLAPSKYYGAATLRSRSIAVPSDLQNYKAAQDLKIIQVPQNYLTSFVHQQQQQHQMGKTAHQAGGVGRGSGGTGLVRQPSFTGSMHGSPYAAGGPNSVPVRGNRTPSGGSHHHQQQQQQQHQQSSLMYGQQSIGSVPTAHTLVDVQSPLSNASMRNINSVENSGAISSGNHTQAIGSVTSVSRQAKAHGLTATLLVSDTVADLHYDTAFDSCPICSCYQNIRAVDLGFYLTPPREMRQNDPHSGFHFSTNSSNRCTCGFSAVRHRFLSAQSGLFEEDQLEATGKLKHVRDFIEQNLDFKMAANRKFVDLIRQQSLLRDLSPLFISPTELLRQCNRALNEVNLALQTPWMAVAEIAPAYFQRRQLPRWTEWADYSVSTVEIKEWNEFFTSALEAACMVLDEGDSPARSVRPRSLFGYFHWWGMQKAAAVNEPKDGEYMADIRQLQPLFKEAMASLSTVGASVEGPLTWRLLERKSLKGTGGSQEEEPQPEPIPQMLVSLERETISVSPQTLRLWDKLLLEPYSQPKDVVYIGVVPDNQLVVERAKVFFHELSKTYETCRFGRHVKYSKDLRDGLLRVGRLSMDGDEHDRGRQQQQGRPSTFQSRHMAYRKMCEETLGPLLDSQNLFDKQVFKDILIRENQQPFKLESMPPPPIPGAAQDAGGTEAGVDGLGSDSEDQLSLPHVVVIYLVNPFLFGPDNHDEITAKKSTALLLQSFSLLLSKVSKRQRPFVQLEIVQLQSIFDCTATMTDQARDDRGTFAPAELEMAERRFSQRLSASDTLKQMALSVYSSSRLLHADVVRSIQGKSMTCFGPAATSLHILKQINKNFREPVFKLYNNAYLLAPSPLQKVTNVVASGGKQGDPLALTNPLRDDTVLFVSYCLITEQLHPPKTGQRQNWLAATATDQQGRILENCLIHLDLSAVQRQQQSVRYKEGSLIRDALCRLWQFITGVLTGGCKPWRLVVGKLGRLGHGEMKAWAQLLSRPNLRRFNQHLKDMNREGFCDQCHLAPGLHETPSILSACLVSTEPELHLRVFPSSFVAEDRGSKQAAKSKPLRTPEDASCTHILVFPTSTVIIQPGDTSHVNVDEDGDDFTAFPFPADDMGDLDLDKLFDEPTSSGPMTSRLDGQSFFGPDMTDMEMQNQPLAVGYLVSTAPALGLPDWFWANCPAAKRRNPAHLKSSLHLCTQNVQQSDDIALSKDTSRSSAHQLDSRRTDNVLRFVLETYNALSWLNVDLVTGERRCCLPVHVQALLRLCNGVAKLLDDDR